MSRRKRQKPPAHKRARAKRRGPAPQRPDVPRPDRPVDWDAFLAALRENPGIGRACAIVGVEPGTERQKRREDPSWAAAVEAAREEAYHELEADVYERARHGWRPGPCERCGGSGAIDGPTPEAGLDRCPDCRGSGREQLRERPSDQLATLVLRARLKRVYGKEETLNLNVRPVIRLRIGGAEPIPMEQESGAPPASVPPEVPEPPPVQ